MPLPALSSFLCLELSPPLSPVGVTALSIAMALHWCCLNTARGDFTAGKAPRAGLDTAKVTQGHPKPQGQRREKKLLPVS